MDEKDEVESQATEPVIQPRRSRRNGVEETPKESATVKKDEEEENGADDEALEEEVTRCICGSAEYPGPGEVLRGMVKGERELKSLIEQGRALNITATEALGDELGSFFVCCDKCSVWQHGGCVGLTNEDTLPDEYYCELCKPELHKIIRGING